MPEESRGTLPLPGTRWRGLTVQMFLLVIVPLTVLLLAISFGGAYLHQSAMRTLVGERDQRAALTAADALSEQLNHRAAAIRGLAQRANEEGVPEEILATSEYLLPDFDGGLALFTSEGELIDSIGPASFWEKLPAEGVDVLGSQLSLSTVEPLFSEPVSHPDFSEPILFVSARAVEGSPVAVGAFTPIGRNFKDTFLESGFSTVFVVTPDYQVLYHTGSPSEEDFPRSHPGVAPALSGETGTTYYQQGNDELVVAYSQIAPTGWALVLEEPWGAVASPLLRTTEAAPLVLVPVVVLALVALWFGARQIIQPLQALEARAAALAWGDYDAVKQEVGGIAEIGRLQHTLMHMANKVQRAQQGLRGYIGAITTGQEEERLRVARELHDDTIQSLIALNQKIQFAQITHEPAPDGYLNEFNDMTEHIIQDVRRLTSGLRPLYLEDLGLVAALDMLVQETGQTSNLAIALKALGAERRLVPEVELAFYRIAQEGLNNILRHSEAKAANLAISFSPREVVMTIEDDGKGFEVPESPAEFAPAGHFGLLGIYERAELIGARLEIQSAPNHGARLIIALPQPG